MAYDYLKYGGRGRRLRKRVDIFDIPDLIDRYGRQRLIDMVRVINLHPDEAPLRFPDGAGMKCPVKGCDGVLNVTVDVNFTPKEL